MIAYNVVPEVSPPDVSPPGRQAIHFK